MGRKQQRSVAMDATLSERLADLDLRTWVIDYLRWHEWGRRREFTLLSVESVRLVEVTSPPGAPVVLGEIDRGELRVTSRRITVTGSGFVRSTPYTELVGWSFGDSSVSVADARSGRLWHASDCRRSDAFLTAVIINLAENFVGDDVPGLDHVTSSDIESYIEAFERDEVAPVRQKVAEAAAILDDRRQQ